MSEDLADHLLIFDKGNHPHFPPARGAYQRIDFPGSGPGQAPIFWISRAQLLRNALSGRGGSRT
jgi:hypothetical protein